ncbi:MAG: hypothetical protein L0Z50_18845 [Verrucomicrobiales bacterium]|nr:hypothetical protein [Verrucomicrobiales bacterium]
MTSLRWALRPDEAAAVREDVILSFEAIQWTYFMVDPNGAVIPSTTSWDATANRRSGPLTLRSFADSIGAASTESSRDLPAFEPFAFNPAEGKTSEKSGLTIQQLAGREIKLQYDAAGKGPFRLQSAAELHSSAWRDITLKPEQADAFNRWFWKLPKTNTGQAQALFRVIEEPASNPAKPTAD